MVTFGTKLCAVEFDMPILSEDHEYWLPDSIKDSGIKVEHIALWKMFDRPNNHLGTYIAFISEEDANFMLLKYPEMRRDTHIWPPAPTDKIFTNFE